MCGLVIFCRGIGKIVLPKSIPPCTSLISYAKKKWVSWHVHSFTLQMSVVMPAIFIWSAKQSGKAGSKSQVKFSEKLEHEVGQVLQNYLHYTRSLSFADAEHISLYAPCFLRKLVSRVNAKDRISEALERYLLYNPINEFEPFFESIGVKTSEIHLFLPPGKIYLNEDESLLANVSILRNSGFPRHVLGKLYTEHPELFSRSAAKLQKKLQFYEKLGVSKVSLIKILTCCPSLLNDEVYKKFVTVSNGLDGFQVEKNRICCLLEKNPLKCSRILEKLMLLAGIGCPWDEISKLYRTKPQLFMDSSEKTLYSIVDVLSNLGLRKENIGNIILHYPEILRWDPSKSMAGNLDFASVGLDQKEKTKTDLCHPRYLHDNLIKLIEDINCTGLEKQGVAVSIREHLKNTMLMTPLSKVSSETFQNIPSVLSELVRESDDLVARGSKREYLKSTMHRTRLSKVSSKDIQNNLSGGSELVRRRDDLNASDVKLRHSPGTREINITKILQEPIERHKLNLLLKLGLIDYPESAFKVARMIGCGGNKLQERLSCLLRLGLPFNDVCQMVRTRPKLLYTSSDLIQKKFDFLCSTTFNPLQVLPSFPKYFTYDLEGRIKPRYKMCAWLKKNNFLKNECGAFAIFTPPERRFVQKYVNCHPEGSKYFSLCKIDKVLPRTPLSKVSSENFQNLFSGGSELVHRRDDLNVHDAKLKHSPGTQIYIAENLQEPIERHKLNLLLKLGLINYPQLMFTVARRIHCAGNKLQERLSCLLRLGLPFNDVCQMVLPSFPKYLECDLEGRIKPRYKMYAWLKKNDLLKKETSAYTIFGLPERRFVQKYVNCHPEGSKYFSICKLDKVMPRTALSKVSSKDIQNNLSGGSELVRRRDDLNASDLKLRHSPGTREINITKILQEPIERHKLNLLLKLGLIDYPESAFKVARMIRCGGNKLQERLSCLLRLGLPFNDICQMVRTRPKLLSTSSDLIQKKFDFLCSTTFNPLQVLPSFPKYFTYDLEGRIKPRYKMCAWLKKNNFLKNECGAFAIFTLPERRFVQKYVNCHPEGSKYFSLCKLDKVMPGTPLAKVSSENFQNLLSGGSELIHRRDVRNVSDTKLRHSSGPQEINITENLQEPIQRHKLNILLKLGVINYSESTFKVARMIHCGGNTLQEKLSCLLRLGLPFNVVCQMVRKWPRLMSKSVDLIQQKFDFLCTTTFNPLQVLPSFPKYFVYDLEGRIKPRYKMYAWLKKNGFVKQKIGATTIFGLPERRFIQNYVNCHPEGSKYFSLCKPRLSNAQDSIV